MANPNNEQRFAAFEESWSEDPSPEIQKFLPPRSDPEYLEILTELVRIDIEHSWSAGLSRRLEYYQQLFPDEFSDREVLQQIAFEEYRARIDHGQPVSPAEYEKHLGIDASQWPLLTGKSKGRAAENSTDSTVKLLSDDACETNGALIESIENWRPEFESDYVSSRLFADSLQRRLRYVSLSASIMFAYLTALVLSNPSEKAGLFLGNSLTITFNTASLAISVALYFVLRFRRLSTQRLRQLEIGLFGLALANFSIGYFSDLMFDHELREPLAKGDHALFHYSSSWSLPFFVLIIAYGTLIPSGMRRCLRGVIGIALIPIGISMVGATIEGGWSKSFVVSFLLQMIIWMVFAIGIATYGVQRIESLRDAIRKGFKVGSYKLGKLLNSGGMGEVYEAVHTLLGRPCAIKIMHERFASDHESFVRFEREVRAMAEISHGNVVRIFDFGRADDGAFFYVMELLNGENLEQSIARDGPMDPVAALPILLQILSAIQAIHANGLVHRDIKPGNIFLLEKTQSQNVKLLDFGLVQVTSNSSVDITTEGAIVGTPAFMSPEQAAGLDVDFRTDIYSFGAVAYYMLHGSPPFVRDSIVETLNAHISEPLTPLKNVRPETTLLLDETISRCLAKDPECRVSRLVEIRQCLQDIRKNLEAGFGRSV